MAVGNGAPGVWVGGALVAVGDGKPSTTEAAPTIGLHAARIKLDKIRTGGIHVETTSDSLALRIGRLLNKAYKGDTRFDFHYGDKSVDIKWHREK